MKKYLFSALALPLLFACSTDDFEKPVANNNDPYPGIQKVNATFYMDEGPVTRMDKTGWTLENGDLYGFAWMGDGEYIKPTDDATGGFAFQNHNLIQTNGIFQPQTSIYVGDYFIYRPYDYETVSPQKINFSLAAQPMAEGISSKGAAWKALAKSAIIIADKWTNILPGGRTYGTDTKIWDEPGIDKPYKVFAAFFSNQTGLDLTYTNNNPVFGDGGQPVKGATDIDYTETGSAGAADIYGATIKLTGAANSFKYGPKATPNAGNHAGTFWLDKTKESPCIANACTFANEDGDDVITLTAPKGAPIKAEESTGFFWFNSLPVTTGQGAATLSTPIKATVKTSYGTVTIDKNSQANTLTIGDCAWVFEDPTGKNWEAEDYAPEWMKLVAADNQDLTPLTGKKYGIHNNTFVNQFGNHKGKYVLGVDFSTAVMDIHIVDDAHLQKYLKFYLASGKTGGANLVLDGASENDTTFEISKISIALLQTINKGKAADKKVLVAPCKLDAHHAGPVTHRVKIVVTQDGQDKVGLKDAKAVPTLNDVFATTAVFTNDNEDVDPVPVYLSKDCEWTWGDNIKTTVGGADVAGMLEIDGQVASITNEGKLTVTNTNVQLSLATVAAAAPAPAKYYLVNAAGATMDIAKVTTVKNDLTNLGTINIGSTTNKKAELRAYNSILINDATDAIDLTKRGKIYNYGALGATDNTTGVVNNYGEIFMMHDGAITLLRSNELNEPAFNTPFKAATNKMGTVTLPEGNPYAIVSVKNEAENGFIKYDWDKPVYIHDSGNVKYNTIVVRNNIEFKSDANGNTATEIQYIEFEGDRIQVVNPQYPDTKLLNLKGIIVKDNSSIIIEKTNAINCHVSAFIGDGATVYKGGKFVYPATAPTNNYFGTWSTDQVVVW